MQILSSWDLIKKGKKADKKKYRGAIFQPVQMCSVEEKDQDWIETNIDWFETIGIAQLRRRYTKVLKNYELAAGVIDKADYIREERKSFNDHDEINFEFLDLSDDDELPDALNINFYPIIPNVIKVLTGEFSKRYQEVNVQAVDQFSRNEKLDAKYEKIKEYATTMAKMKLYNKLMESGYQPESEEELQQIQEEVEQQVQAMPHIQSIFNKNYRSTFEKWAQHQIKQDDQRFNMYEKENMAFADYLKQDCQFWHIDLMENDYNVELWSPLNTFYHISQDKKYTSEANFIGRITMMSIADAIDKYKEKLQEEDLEALEELHYTSNKLVPYGSPNEAYYDETRSYSNQYPNDINVAKRMSSMMHNGIPLYSGTTGDIRTFDDYINARDTYNYPVVQVTELYWRSQKKMGYLTKIDEFGNLTSEVITEDYLITQKPVYDTTFYKTKDKKSLIYGEHVDWFWINEVYKGCKIDASPLVNKHLGSSNKFRNSYPGQLYFDCGPLKFQFKGEDSLWDSRIPVEGIAKSDIRLPEGVSLVDLMKPYQIKYNIVNNQMKDILLDERGTVILMDQGAIPTNSMGEDWGPNNFAKVGYTMDEFGILPVDTSLQNMGERTAFSHFQTLNLEQSNRFMSRLQIAQWAKQEAFATVGITPQRLGSIAASETATGTQQAIQNSYSQTEMYFVEHINFLMPRVRNMMINAAQYYNATEKSVQLSYMNEQNEEIFFEIEGYKLLARDFQVYTNFKPNSRHILEQMKGLVLNNNTTNANIYDLLKVISANTPSEVIEHAKKSVDDFNAQQKQQAEQQQMLQQQALEAEAIEKDKERAFEAQENQLDREKDIYEAQIKAMGYQNDGDVNQDQTPDVLQMEKFNQDYAKFQENLNLQREKMMNDNKKHQDQMNIKQQELNTKKEIADKQLEIARENKNRYDKPKSNKSDKKK
jgi:hypothetical protein